MLLITEWQVSGLLYSCLLLRMCNAYAVVVLFVFKYRWCSWFLVSTVFQSDQQMICCMFCIAVRIMYWSLFCFVVICRIDDCIRCYMFEMLCLCRYFWTVWYFWVWGLLWYVNVIYFSLWNFVGDFFDFCVLIILFLKLWVICIGNSLFLAMVHLVFHSCCLACSVIGVDSIMFM